MGRRNHNRNVTVSERTATELGARVLRIANKGKHHSMHIETAAGVRFWLPVSMGHIDPYKLKGWVRQAINRADGRKDHYAQNKR